MAYEIYINNEFDCKLYSIVDVFEYVNKNSLQVITESEYIDYNMVKLYCEEV